MPFDTRSRQYIVALISASTFCLVYFYALDRAAFSSAHFSPIFKTLLEHDSATAWLSFGVCWTAVIWSQPSPVLRLVDFVSRNMCWITPLTILAICSGSIAIYHSYPLSMDEYAAVFQAKIFASGHLVAHLPASVIDWLVMPGFNGTFLIASRETGKAIEGYWPGFSLLLAPFEIVQMPFLCNALLAGLALYLVFKITEQIAGDVKSAAWATLFTLSSSVFLVYAMSFYAMQAHLTANLFFVYLLLRPTPRSALAAGFVGSLALLLHNGLPHAVFAIPWILSIAKDKQQRLLLGPLALGYLPGIAASLAWLWLRADVVPVTHTLSGISGVGTGVFVWPNAALFNMRTASAVKMWLWSMPGLYLLAAWGYTQSRDKRPVRLLAYSAALTFCAYCFVQLDQGHGWGYRYFHSAWGAVPVLAGCAMRRVAAQPRFTAVVGAATVLSALLLVPFQLTQVDRVLTDHLSQLEPAIGSGNNVYFVRPASDSYVADMIQIDPTLRDQNLYLSSRGSALDLELIHQNWPNATLVRRGIHADQWYLGDADQRSTIGEVAAPHFQLTFTPKATDK